MKPVQNFMFLPQMLCGTTQPNYCAEENVVVFFFTKTFRNFNAVQTQKCMHVHMVAVKRRLEFKHLRVLITSEGTLESEIDRWER